jgi:N-acetylmuramoyl-L-alanine amidase
MKLGWKEMIYKNIPAKMLLANPTDIKEYCNGWEMIGERERRNFYVNLFTELCRFESGFNPKCTYKENFNDAKGKPVISTGLFQVSVESLGGYGFKVTQENLFDPETNIKAMLTIASKWIIQDGCLASDKSPWKGISRYFSPFRDPKRKNAIKKATLAVNYGGEKVMDKNAMRLAIIVGHDKKSKGAFSKTLGVSEYDFNGEMAIMAKTYAEIKGVACEVFYRDGVGIAGAVKNALKFKPNCIIEWHFNAADGTASGTETLYSDHDDTDGINEVLFAKTVNNAMVGVLGLKDRGIKKLLPGGRGYGNLAVAKSVPSILIEPFFGDTPKDAKAAINNKQELAQSVVDAFIKFMS